MNKPSLPKEALTLQAQENFARYELIWKNLVFPNELEDEEKHPHPPRQNLIIFLDIVSAYKMINKLQRFQPSKKEEAKEWRSSIQKTDPLPKALTKIKFLKKCFDAITIISWLMDGIDTAHPFRFTIVDIHTDFVAFGHRAILQIQTEMSKADIHGLYKEDINRWEHTATTTLFYLHELHLDRLQRKKESSDFIKQDS